MFFPKRQNNWWFTTRCRKPGITFYDQHLLKKLITYKYCAPRVEILISYRKWGNGINNRDGHNNYDCNNMCYRIYKSSFPSLGKFIKEIADKYRICLFSYTYLSKIPPTRVLLLSRYALNSFNPLKTKRKQLYLKTQFVPRSKHFSSRL